MTLAQWIFHYREIQKFKEDEIRSDFRIRQNFIDVIQDIQNDVAEYLSAFIDGELYKQVKEKKNADKAEKAMRMPDDPEEKSKFIKKIYSKLPKQLITTDLKQKSPFFLPRYDKKKKARLGIGEIKKGRD